MITKPPWIVSMLGCSLITIHTQIGPIIVSNKKNKLTSSAGINLGANLGKNLIYSGTISAAFEGTILGIPSAAISLDSFKAENFAGAKYVATSIANHLLKHKLPEGTMLNVNVPNIDQKDLKGFLVTKQGNQSFRDLFEKRIDPRGNSYFWIKGELINDNKLGKITTAPSI